MIDYSLKFPSKTEATLALFDGEQQRYPNTDIIGTITREDGTTTAGFHVNVRVTEEAPELEAYRVYPVTPVRVWF